MHPHIDNIKPNWLKRYAMLYNVSLEEAGIALLKTLRFARNQGVNCQALDCTRSGAAFVLRVNKKVTKVRHLCPEHWLQAVEEGFYSEVDSNE